VLSPQVLGLQQLVSVGARLPLAGLNSEALGHENGVLGAVMGLELLQVPGTQQLASVGGKVPYFLGSYSVPGGHGYVMLGLEGSMFPHVPPTGLGLQQVALLTVVLWSASLLKIDPKAVQLKRWRPGRSRFMSPQVG
jgi:hypothetical protein